MYYAANVTGMGRVDLESILNIYLIDPLFQLNPIRTAVRTHSAFFSDT